MKTSTVSLKQLRTNPREYIRLINSGQVVAITEHNKTIANTRPAKPTQIQEGNIHEILKAIKSLPPIKTPYPNEDTVELIKRTRLEGYEEKLQKLENQNDDRS